MSEPHWVEVHTGWGELIRDEKLAALGLVWDSAQSSGVASGEKVASKHASSMPRGTLWSDALWEMNVEMARDKIAVARGGATARTGLGFELEPVWYVDANSPQCIWLAASESLPPVYWLEVEPASSAMCAALASISPAPDDAPRRRTRAIMGYEQQLGVPNPYSGEFEPASPDALGRYWISSPFHLGLFNAWATIFTRTRCDYAMHANGLYVWDVEYVPTIHASVVERVSQGIGVSYPKDIPLDLLGVLAGFDFMTVSSLEQMLEQGLDDAHLQEALIRMGALRHDDPALEDFLQPYFTHQNEQIRRAAVHVAACYGLDALMARHAAHEPNEELRSRQEQGAYDGAPIIWQRPVE